LHPPSSHQHDTATATATATGANSDQLDNNNHNDDQPSSSLLARVCIIPQKLLLLNNEQQNQQANNKDETINDSNNNNRGERPNSILKHSGGSNHKYTKSNKERHMTYTVDVDQTQTMSDANSDDSDDLSYGDDMLDKSFRHLQRGSIHPNQAPHRHSDGDISIASENKTTKTKTTTTTTTTSVGSLLRDRAAAIAIQCSYELWKERRNRRQRRRRRHRSNSKSRDQVKNPADECQSTPLENEKELLKLKRDLKPFLTIYHNNRLDDNSQAAVVGEEEEEGEKVIVMSWDLAVLWIKFCNVLGYTDVVLSSLIQMLHGLIRWDDTNDIQQYHRDRGQPLIQNGNRNQLSDKENEENETHLRESHYELCHLLLVENAIYIKDITTLQCIIDAIFFRGASNSSVLSLLHERRIATTKTTTKRGENTKNTVGWNLSAEEKYQQIIDDKTKPVREAIHVLCQNIEAMVDVDDFNYRNNDDGRDEQYSEGLVLCQKIQAMVDGDDFNYKNNDDGRGEQYEEGLERQVVPPIGGRANSMSMLAFMEALEDCLEDIRDIKEGMGMKEKEQIQQSSIPSCDDNIVRHHQNNEDHGLGSPNGGRKDNRGNQITNYVVDSLWTSEDRWINRGKVLTAGLIMYSTWRRRKRAFAVGRGAGKVLMAPLREILDALTSK